MISSISSSIAKDPLSMAFDYLDFPDQAACAVCCRFWKNLINHGTFQKKVLKRAQLKDDTPLSVYIKTNHIEALVAKAIELRDCKKRYKVNVLYIDELLARALRQLYRYPDSHYAAFYRAQLKIEYPETPLTDDEAFNLLDGTAKNPLISEELRADSQFLKALLKIENRTMHITKRTAFNLLDYVTNNQYAVMSTRWLAWYHMARLKTFDASLPLADDTAFHLFDQVANNEQISIYIRANSLIGKAYLKFLNRTMLITDEAAFNLLRQVPNIQPAYAEAEYLKARFKVHYRTTEITDEEAFTILDAVVNNTETFMAKIRFTAQYYKAHLKVHNRTELITDEQALNLLNDVINNQEVSAQIHEYALACKRTLIRRQPARCVIL